MTRTYSNSDPEQVRGFAVEAARLLTDLKCSEVVLLDVRGQSQVCDYIVIGSGTSQRQMKSVATDVADLGDTMGMAAFRSNRDDGTTWIVVDFVEVVVHLFEPEQRLYYDLELMWSQAKRLDWKRPAKEMPAGGRPAGPKKVTADDDSDDADSKVAAKSAKSGRPTSAKASAKTSAGTSAKTSAKTSAGASEKATSKPARKRSSEKPDTKAAGKPAASKRRRSSDE